MRKCKTCNRLNKDKTKDYIFCSITCACYSGCFSIQTGMNKAKYKKFMEDWQNGNAAPC